MLPFFALTTRGLETISAREAAALPGVTVTELAYRRVAGHVSNSPAHLLRLRTVDDVFLSLATWENIGHRREALAQMRDLSACLDFAQALDTVTRVRQVGYPPLFSVTASFVGKRNYSYKEIKEATSDGVQASQHWPYSEDDEAADLNVRVFLEHEAGYVGLRLGKRPLHRRPYKQAQVPGSLKPPVAAAMLLLAGAEPGQLALDPCCGAGTIVVEAAQMGAMAWGGDISLIAVEAARENVARAGVRAAIALWDGRSLPFPHASVPCLACNLPWGRQVATDSALRSLYAGICQEINRVLAPGGRVALLTSMPELVNLPSIPLAESLEISIFGQTPALLVYNRPNR